jgi:hypothetical protein
MKYLYHISRTTNSILAVAELQATVADLKAQQVIAASNGSRMHNNFPQFHRQRRSFWILLASVSCRLLLISCV